MEKILSPKTLETFGNAIGKDSFKYFEKSKVFFSSLIYSNNYDNLISQRGNLILKNFSNPFIEDWKVYSTLRSHCKTWITTGKMLRDEKDLNTFHDFDFSGHQDVKNYFYDIGYENFKNDSIRKAFIMSNKMNLGEIFNLKFFQEEKLRKYIMTNEILIQQIKNKGEMLSFQEFSKKNQIYLVDEKIKDIKEAIYYCQNKLHIEDNILLEAGTQIMNNFFIQEEYENSEIKDNPLDFLLLSVYEGVINIESIGDYFSSFEDLKKSGLVLVNISEKIKSEQGFLTFYTFVNSKLL